MISVNNPPAEADMTQATIKGRASGAGTGSPSALTADQVSTILDAATDPFVRTSALSASNVTIGKTIALSKNLHIF